MSCSHNYYFASPPLTSPPPPPSIVKPSWWQVWKGQLQHYIPSPSRMVFSSAFIWHSLAVRSFILSPFNTLRAVTTVRPVSFTSAEVLQYLGGLNIGYAWLALQALFLPRRDVIGRKRSALVLAVANASQVWFTIKFWKSARWAWKGIIPIFIGDAFITLITILYYFQHGGYHHDIVDD